MKKVLVSIFLLAIAAAAVAHEKPTSKPTPKVVMFDGPPQPECPPSICGL